MLETPHVLVGAAIATKIPNPLIAIPLAFASHFILDRVPHWNPHFYTETQKFGKPKNTSTLFEIADELVALGSGLFIAYQALPNYGQAAVIVLCCLAAVISDQIKLPFFYCQERRKGFFKKWVDFERSMQIEVSPFWGILTQVVVSLAALYSLRF